MIIRETEVDEGDSRIQSRLLASSTNPGVWEEGEGEEEEGEEEEVYFCLP